MNVLMLEKTKNKIVFTATRVSTTTKTASRMFAGIQKYKKLIGFVFKPS